MTAYESRISDWSSDVCSSDLAGVLDDAVSGGLVVVLRGPVGKRLGQALDRLDHLVPLATDPAGRLDGRVGHLDRGTQPGQQFLVGVLRVVHLDLLGVASLAYETSLPYCTAGWRSEEHTSELQSLMRISYAVFC